MSQAEAGGGSALAQLPLPLPSLGIEIRATPEDLADAAKEVLETEATWGLDASGGDHFSEFSVASVGSLLIASGRTTPVALQYRQGERLIVEMCYGGQSRFREGVTELRSVAGGMLVFPSAGGTLCGGVHAGISFALERDRLRRTARAMLGGAALGGLEAPFLIEGGGGVAWDQGLMFSLFRHLDAVLREGRDLPAHLALDDLVDFIRANAHHHPLSLTDLEERSHFSARHLQTLFRRAFDCTPMQFVRRQRLSVAMQRLESADRQLTVTRVARDCGYRSVASFSTDFRRQFGVSPSVVLRVSRGQRPPP